MRSERASETAIAAGVLRAAHQILDHDPRILEDPVSVGLVPGSREDEIADQAERLQLDFLRVLRASFVVRSHIAEDAVRRAVAAGAGRYVLLGAGCDSVEHFGPAEYDALFFAGRTDGLPRPAFERVAIGTGLGAGSRPAKSPRARAEVRT